MDTKKRLLRVLFTGHDGDVLEWFRDFVKEKQLPWRVRTSEPLRAIAPDNQLTSQDVIVIGWDRVVGADLGVAGAAPTKRSLEGMLHEFEKIGGELLCSKVIVVGKLLTREDTIFLAEYGVKHVVPLAQKRSKWNESVDELVRRAEKIYEDFHNAAMSPEEAMSARFLGMLPYWQKLNDETKMENTEQLLRTLGDSPRYSELMARKCLAEQDTRGSEKWLQRALSKSPNYIRALHLLTDVYMQEQRIDDALHVLEKLKANNPRSLRTLTKMGQCYALRNEPLRAEKYLTDALSIDEYCKEAREELGKIKFVLREYEEARKLFSHTSSPRPLAAYFNKVGIELVQQGKFSASIDHYRWAQYVLPGNDQSHLLFFNIALAYAKWGKIREALGYARLAKVRSPDYDKAQTLLKKLEERRSA